MSFLRSGLVKKGLLKEWKFYILYTRALDSSVITGPEYIMDLLVVRVFGALCHGLESIVPERFLALVHRKIHVRNKRSVNIDDSSCTGKDLSLLPCCSEGEDRLSGLCRIVERR